MGTEAAIAGAMTMQMGSSIASGYMSYQQGKAQEKMYDKQADVAIKEAKSEAARLRLKHRVDIANMKLQYMHSGIGGGMSVENVLASSENQMDMEARAVLASGAAKAQYLKTQGNFAASEGRAKLLGGIMGGVTSAMTTYAMAKQFGYFGGGGINSKIKGSYSPNNQSGNKSAHSGSKQF